VDYALLMNVIQRKAEHCNNFKYFFLTYLTLFYKHLFQVALALVHDYADAVFWVLYNVSNLWNERVIKRSQAIEIILGLYSIINCVNNLQNLKLFCDIFFAIDV